MAHLHLLDVTDGCVWIPDSSSQISFLMGLCNHLANKLKLYSGFNSLQKVGQNGPADNTLKQH